MKNKEIHTDILLKKLLKESGTKNPSPEFRRNVMDELPSLYSTTIYKYRPVISKRAWQFISAASLFLFAVLIVVVQGDNSISSSGGILTPAMDTFDKVSEPAIKFLSGIKTPVYLSISLAAFWVLLIIDQVLRRISRKSTR